MENFSKKKSSLTLLCDFYELTMMQGYFLNGFENKTCYFDIFFRKIPDKGSFAIFAGLNEILDFVANLHFSQEDIAYLRSQNIFCEDFLKYLEHFKFNGEIYAIQEGEIIFPNEPLMVIKANAIEAQLLETFLLLNINHQSLIATKANRIVRAAKNRPVFEFGSRRAHGNDAAIKGARAAIIGGCIASSCTFAGKKYGIKIGGTMAHSWVQMFDDEFKAFCHYLQLYPKNPILLIDTYDYKQGLSNAIRAFKKFKIKQCGVRIDSGDLEKLSKEIRTILDKNDLLECKIIVSNSLDEKSIEKLLKNKANIDAFGVGEKLITAFSDPIFGCVYKLVAIEENHIIEPKIKISEDKHKTTIPHFKKLFRIYDKKSQKMLFDELYTYDEKLTKLDENLERQELLKCVFKEGRIINKQDSVKKIALYTKNQISKLDEKLLENKEKYKIKLSKNLKNLTKKCLQIYKNTLK
ncbi:nicotinate phosphoribosyltransferase [Campylobacter estrildidarum]|uniref:Nicotinate phosphoribosyltransferase n=1 Tax=Campylobacter estrildidarum TaxID=2510189 RepID=A0A4U7BH43_9BACT|nr:nicotinate phosphoribosyltransferase [Campylobacter estrildidarum]TKX29160.1 nicotinate phosphoribosyltransferase [Campylobacter estrildidarum]